MQDLILQPLDYKAAALPIELTWQPAGTQNFLSSFQHPSCQTTFSKIQLPDLEEINYCSTIESESIYYLLLKRRKKGRDLVILRWTNNLHSQHRIKSSSHFSFIEKGTQSLHRGRLHILKNVFHLGAMQLTIHRFKVYLI